MLAAQRFTHTSETPIHTIFGSISNGMQWQFLALTESTVTIDLTLYTLPPVDQILAFLVWMAQGEPARTA
ncbi:MAG: hypothetical protein AAGC54_15995, partial [Cyanobacteria bacterium P01_F01_bin.4]